MIFYDPTESRSGTRLPQEIIDAGEILRGLESATGSDILVTDLHLPTQKKFLDLGYASNVARLLSTAKSPKEIADATGASLLEVAQITNLWRMTQSGMLIQRKTGYDLIGSIQGGKLTRYILPKMQLWTQEAWLLFNGRLAGNNAGKAFIDGGPTNMGFPQVSGALDAWQRRGGYLKELASGRDVAWWIAYLNDNFQKLRDERPSLPRLPVQKMSLGNSDDAWMTLATFPFIGETLAIRLIEYCGNLGRAIEFLSDPDAESYENRPRGIGKEILRHARKHLGLEPNNIMAVIGIEETTK